MRADTQPDYTGAHTQTSLRPAASCVVQQELQQRIEDRLHETRAGGKIHCSVVVLFGLGGAEKSQLAPNDIQTHRTEYDAGFWVDARMQESLERH